MNAKLAKKIRRESKALAGAMPNVAKKICRRAKKNYLKERAS